MFKKSKLIQKLRSNKIFQKVTPNDSFSVPKVGNLTLPYKDSTIITPFVDINNIIYFAHITGERSSFPADAVPEGFSLEYLEDVPL